MLPKSKPHLTPQHSKIIRILIVDDLKTIREFLFSVLDAESDLEVIGMATNGEDAVVKSLELQPDLILMDIEMPKQNGISASRIILQQLSEVKILVFSSNVNREYVLDSLAAGAKGYLLKNVSEAELIEAIHYVYKGYLHVAPGVFEQLLSFSPKLSSPGQAEKSLQSDEVNASPHVLRQGTVHQPSAATRGSMPFVTKSVRGTANRLQSSPSTKPLTTPEPFPAKQKFRSGVRWITWSAILALISISGLVIYSWIYSRRSQPVAVNAVEVSKKTVRDLVNQTGVVELGNQQNLKSPVDGTVEKVAIAEGEMVDSEQILVVLKDPDRETALEQQQLEIQKQELISERSQQKVSEISQQLELARQKQAVEIANQIRQQQQQIVRNREKIAEDRQRLEIAKAKLQQSQKLFTSGVVAKNDLQNQQEDLLNIQSQLKDTELNLATAVLTLQTLQQQQRDKRQELFDDTFNLQTQLKDARSQAETNFRELNRLRLEEKEIEQKIEQNLIKANFWGRILNLKVRAGDVVELGDILLTMGNPHTEMIRLELSPLEARQVKVGQIAHVRMIAPQAQLYGAKVAAISQAAVAIQQKESEDQENADASQGKVIATLKLDSPSKDLLPGSKVDVKIDVASRNNVVAIGQDLVQNYDTNPFVWVEDERGKAQKQDVSLGLNGMTTVEVTSGLSVGDRVIIPPPDSPLAPGMSVIMESSLKNK